MAAVLVIALVVVVVGVIGVGLPVLDSYCAAVAERRAGDALAAPFGRPATVRVAGRPFLTQLLRGRYASVHITGGGLRIGEMTGATLDARLRNLYINPRDLVRRRVAEAPCEHLEGSLVLPYGELARVAKVPGLELRPSRDRVVATAALPVPGISQLARVSGRAVLTLGEGNTVWLRVRGVSVAGISLPSVVLHQLLPALEVPIPLPQLPFGLRIDEVRAADEGLIVLGSASAVVFRTSARAADPTSDPDSSNTDSSDTSAADGAPDAVDQVEISIPTDPKPPAPQAIQRRPRPTGRDAHPDG